MNAKPPKLFSLRRKFSQRSVALHVGLPKTASTAIQNLFYRHRNFLRSRGLFYPDVANMANPRHQQIVDAFLDNNTLFIENFFRFSEDVNRIIVSCESITNELYNIDPSNFRHLVEFLKSSDVSLQIYLVNRNVLPWAISYYKQAIINQTSSRMKFYSTSRKFQEFMDITYIKKLVDRNHLINDLENFFGSKLVIFDYETDSVEKIARRITGLPLNDTSNYRNLSIPDTAIEILRQINGFITTRDEKYAWSRILYDTIGIEHETLKALADRAGNDALLSIDSDQLDLIRFSENQPLKIDKKEFFRILIGMHNSIRRNLAH